MSDTPSKLFGLLALLLCVWVVTYWLYVPSSASMTPRVTLDPRVSDAPPPPVPQDGSGSVPVGASGASAGTGSNPPTLREPQIPLPPPPGAQANSGAAANPKPTTPVRTHRVQKVIEPQWRTYVVQRGDTGWRAVAARKEVFGDASKWQIVARSNPLVTPDRLKPGKTELRIPLDPENIQGKVVWVEEPIPDDRSAEPTREPAARPEQAAPAVQTYTLTRDDTLWEVSKRFYGKGSRWRVIYEANRALIPDPDRPPAGVTIQIPPAASP